MVLNIGWLTNQAWTAPATCQALCARFGVSRASLYRMFEPDGGLLFRCGQLAGEAAANSLTQMTAICQQGAVMA
jgi:AraC-like DNA-binding protein